MFEGALPACSLITRIVSALKESGRDLDSLTNRDLAPVSELHNRGREATLDLANLAGIEAGHHVLDVGCGIGGPARTLAAEFGCRVTGVDISEEFCDAARFLNEQVGLSGRIEIRRADAIALPFEDWSFDIIWTQHASMNIADKHAFLSEIHRVLKPGGKLAIHDVMAGAIQPIHFPVPWAPDPQASFLAVPDELRSLAVSLGFHELAWQDHTELTENWWRKTRERVSRQRASPLNPGLVMGSQFAAMANNMYRNIGEGRVAIILAVLQKQAAFGARQLF